jgi:hypothetical protein
MRYCSFLSPDEDTSTPYFFHNESQTQSGSKKGRAQETALVMCVTEDNFQFFANFICSARAQKIDLGNLIAFATSAKVKDMAKAALDVQLFLPPDDGWFQKHLSPGGVAGVTKAHLEQWWAAVAVWFVLEAGYHVLWQASNTVWLADPWADLYNKEKEWKDENQLMTRWVDEGRRDSTFAPFDVSVDFFFIRRYQYRRTEHSGKEKGFKWYWETGLTFWRQLLSSFETSMAIGHAEHVNELLGFHQPTRMSLGTSAMERVRG